MQIDAMWSMRYDAMPYNVTQCDTIRYDTTQHNIKHNFLSVANVVILKATSICGLAV